MARGVQDQPVRKWLIDRVPGHSNRFIRARQLRVKPCIAELASKAFLEAKNCPIGSPNTVGFMPLGLLKPTIRHNNCSAQPPTLRWSAYTGRKDDLPANSRPCSPERVLHRQRVAVVDQECRHIPHFGHTVDNPKRREERSGIGSDHASVIRAKNQREARVRPNCSRREKRKQMCEDR
jgi:hypothetical protein